MPEEVKPVKPTSTPTHQPSVVQPEEETAPEGYQNEEQVPDVDGQPFRVKSTDPRFRKSGEKPSVGDESADTDVVPSIPTSPNAPVTPVAPTTTTRGGGRRTTTTRG